jgi:esterase
VAQDILNHERVAAEGASPGRWLYMLHGIFGAGRNWASLARRIVRERPEWGALLVDLRQHGGSQGFAPPHTLDAAAADIHRLAEHTGMPPGALLGHSFGGKVALVYARTPPPTLEQIWIVDSTPEAGEPGGSAWRMLEIVTALPRRFDTRRSLVAALEHDGVEPAIAQWMATNLEARDGAYTWRFELDALEALLRDFFATDAFDVIEAPPPGATLHIVRATRSSVLAGRALARVREASAAGLIALHDVEGGHWLNADNPGAIVDLVAGGLPAA